MVGLTVGQTRVGVVSVRGRTVTLGTVRKQKGIRVVQLKIDICNV